MTFAHITSPSALSMRSLKRLIGRGETPRPSSTPLSVFASRVCAVLDCLAVYDYEGAERLVAWLLQHRVASSAQPSPLRSLLQSRSNSGKSGGACDHNDAAAALPEPTPAPDTAGCCPDSSPLPPAPSISDPACASLPMPHSECNHPLVDLPSDAAATAAAADAAADKEECEYCIGDGANDELAAKLKSKAVADLYELPYSASTMSASSPAGALDPTHTPILESFWGSPGVGCEPDSYCEDPKTANGGHNGCSLPQLLSSADTISAATRILSQLVALEQEYSSLAFSRKVYRGFFIRWECHLETMYNFLYEQCYQERSAAELACGISWIVMSATLCLPRVMNFYSSQGTQDLPDSPSSPGSPGSSGSSGTPDSQKSSSTSCSGGAPSTQSVILGSIRVLNEPGPPLEKNPITNTCMASPVAVPASEDCTDLEGKEESNGSLQTLHLHQDSETGQIRRTLEKTIRKGGLCSLKIHSHEMPPSVLNKDQQSSPSNTQNSAVPPPAKSYNCERNVENSSQASEANGADSDWQQENSKPTHSSLNSSPQNYTQSTTITFPKNAGKAKHDLAMSELKFASLFLNALISITESRKKTISLLIDLAECRDLEQIRSHMPRAVELLESFAADVVSELSNSFSEFIRFDCEMTVCLLGAEIELVSDRLPNVVANMAQAARIQRQRERRLAGLGEFRPSKGLPVILRFWSKYSHCIAAKTEIFYPKALLDDEICGVVKINAMCREFKDKMRRNCSVAVILMSNGVKARLKTRGYSFSFNSVERSVLQDNLRFWEADYKVVGSSFKREHQEHCSEISRFAILMSILRASRNSVSECPLEIGEIQCFDHPSVAKPTPFIACIDKNLFVLITLQCMARSVDLQQIMVFTRTLQNMMSARSAFDMILKKSS